jgi:hypothetical protein
MPGPDSQLDGETVSPVKVGLGAVMGQGPVAHPAVREFEDRGDAHL